MLVSIRRVFIYSNCDPTVIQTEWKDFDVETVEHSELANQEHLL